MHRSLKNVPEIPSRISPTSFSRTFPRVSSGLYSVVLYCLQFLQRIVSEDISWIYQATSNILLTIVPWIIFGFSAGILLKNVVDEFFT